MAKDWVDDENLTREETLARFEALNPEPTTGPRLPEGGTVAVAPSTYGGATTTRQQHVTAHAALVANGRQLTTA